MQNLTLYLEFVDKIHGLVDKLPLLVDKNDSLVDKLPHFVDKIMILVDKLNILAEKVIDNWTCYFPFSIQNDNFNSAQMSILRYNRSIVTKELRRHGKWNDTSS